MFASLLEQKSRMITAAEALPGRPTPMPVPEAHFVNGRPMTPPYPAGLEVAEYATRLVKKALVGTGAAEKEQVRAMVERLMPGVKIKSTDAADALAVAICHAHHRASAKALGGYR